MKDGEKDCPKCGSDTYIEPSRGWWCSNKKCVLSKKKKDNHKSDAPKFKV